MTDTNPSLNRRIINRRITHLDTVRGVAVMGILIINSISFGLGNVAVFDISTVGTVTNLDWVLAIVGEIFADQKFMGLFSLLFGASLLLFLDRVTERTPSPVRLSLWRNLLLLAIGVVHSLFWVGDILVVYALCAPILLMLGQVSPKALILTGMVVFISAVIPPLILNSEIDDAGLRAVWGGDDLHPQAGAIFLEIMCDVFSRALGMMMIGMGLYRSGFLTRPISRKSLVRCLSGIAVGALLSAAGLIWVACHGFDARAVVLGNIPNTLATIPMTLGYLGVLMGWDERATDGLIRCVRAVGRMALTNYLAQTFLCLQLAKMIPTESVTRTSIWVAILFIWAGQLIFSEFWLRRYRMGPLEWLWRCATYRCWFPLLR